MKWTCMDVKNGYVKHFIYEINANKIVNKLKKEIAKHNQHLTNVWLRISVYVLVINDTEWMNNLKIH